MCMIILTPLTPNPSPLTPDERVTGASKDLEKTIQAVQRGTSCNAEAMREMGIDKIDFGGLAQVSFYT